MLVNFTLTTDIVANINKAVSIANIKIIQAENGNNWHKVLDPLNRAMQDIKKLTAINSHLNNVVFNEKFSKIYEQTLPIISNFYSKLGANKKLYAALTKLKKTNLSTKKQYILNKMLNDYELLGVNLNELDSKKFIELQTKLTTLGNNFSNNILKATNAYNKTINIDKLSGLNKNELTKLKQKDGYYINLQIPIYITIMTYADDSNLRKELYSLYVTRASEFSKFDNTIIIKNILSIRENIAKLLKFDNYSTYSLTNKMAKNTKNVEDFLLTLITKAKPQAEKELAELTQFAGKKIEAWDIMYYSEKLKQQKFSINKSKLAEYFPFNNVLNGLFVVIKKLYNLKVEIIKEKTYHQDILVLEFRENNKLIGKTYFDPFARKNKRSGAWMSDYQDYDNNQLPINFIICNFNAPKKNTPSLLEFDDITTLFHEFGHAIHHLLTNTKYPSITGIDAMPWDAIELPSQYMEFFVYEKTTIKQLSKHYKTNKKIPDNVIDKIILAKNFQSAMAMLRQCEFALWDLYTHIDNFDTYKILAKVKEKTELVKTPEKNRFLHTFEHIFNGSYASGYYSYKWAEMLAADAYKITVNNNNQHDFRKYILESGGSYDFMSQYLKFSQSKPKITTLLQANNIK